jgi:hypothetical protein
MVLAHERTIPTERQPLLNEVSANFCGYMMWRGQRNGSPKAAFSAFSFGVRKGTPPENIRKIRNLLFLLNINILWNICSRHEISKRPLLNNDSTQHLLLGSGSPTTKEEK